jgi:hypothetical protein
MAVETEALGALPFVFRKIAGETLQLFFWRIEIDGPEVDLAGRQTSHAGDVGRRERAHFSAALASPLTCSQARSTASTSASTSAGAVR